MPTSAQRICRNRFGFSAANLHFEMQLPLAREGNSYTRRADFTLQFYFLVLSHDESRRDRLAPVSCYRRAVKVGAGGAFLPATVVGYLL